MPRCIASVLVAPVPDSGPDKQANPDEDPNERENPCDDQDGITHRQGLYPYPVRG